VAVPSFTFDVIPGLSYAIDLTQPARFDPEGRLINPQARRIVGLSMGGRLLAPDEQILLVTNNHRASQATAAATGCAPRVVLADGTRSQTALADHVRRKGVIGAPPQRNWHFLPMPGTTLRIATGIGADAYLADIAAYRPQFIDRDSNGFLHYRLHL
jgi:2',3'-cyclic-nucleotide 2'-phosphodiesterase/3'-nucleotidase